MEASEYLKSLRDSEAKMKAKIERLATYNDPQRDVIVGRVEQQIAAVQKEIRQLAGKAEE